MNMLDFLKSIICSNQKSKRQHVKETMQSAWDNDMDENYQESVHLYGRIINDKLSTREEVAMANNNLGVVYNKIGEHEKASSCYDDVFDFGYSCVTYFNKAFSLYKCSKIDDAIAYFRKALEQESEMRDDCSVFLACCYVVLKRYDKAIEQITIHLRNVNETEAEEVLATFNYAKYFYFYYGIGVVSESVTRTDFSKDKPFFARVGFCLSKAYETLDRSDRATAMKELVCTLDSWNELEKEYQQSKSDEPCTYVDLGLRSGTLWARANIGAADQPQELGTYFTMGNLPDGLPTYEQAQELIEECQFDMFILLSGPCDRAWKLTGPNGNSILFPIEKDNEACCEEAATSWCQCGSFPPFMCFLQHTLTIGAAVSPDVKIQARRVKCCVQDNKKNH